MLKQIIIKNFRGFDSHVLDLLPTTIIVGRNNAGKSTIVEALRLLSLVVTECKNRGAVLRRWRLSRSSRTLKRSAPSLQLYEIETSKRVFHRYGEPPAEIRGRFTSGAEVFLQIWDEEITARVSAKRASELSYISCLPQVGPLALEEKRLSEETIKGAISSRLAPLHFRNQIYYLKDVFPDFKAAVEASWHGLRVDRPESYNFSSTEEHLTMMVYDNDFAAEVAWMGHGLQMWLQTMWFLARVRNHETVILDEPDVYMHADLQRKLIRFLKGRHPQIIVASHSPEIMAEVEPEQILIVDKSQKESTYAANIPIAQRLLNSLGSVHNIQLARLSAAKRFLFVEGKDVAILKRIKDSIYPNSDLALDTISMSVGGWGGWDYAVGSTRLLNQTGVGSMCYAIFDSDYHTPEEVQKRKDDACGRNISIHVWSRKELENYLLVPAAIHRALNKKCGDLGITQTQIIEIIDNIVSGFYDDVHCAIGSEIQKQNRGKEWATVAKESRAHLDSAWKTMEGRWGIVSGKQVLSHLSSWCQENLGLSLSPINVAREIREYEISPELVEVLRCIEKGIPFTQ